MIRHCLTAFIASLLLCLSIGCYSAPVMPPPGIVFMNVDAPISTVVAGESLGSRSGEASATSILGIAAWGDASVQAAARNGGIQEPRHIDYRFLSVLGLYQRFTTIVRGE